MKKYKPLSLFLDYMQDFYGPTLTERNLYDPNYEHLAVTNLRFKYSGTLPNKIHLIRNLYIFLSPRFY